ncbi:hypothetical protein [Salinispora tropica]|uniref:Uncharacterized protein n=1 Tax=Salinispora tropica (strain ATCC BAA-916 / DSM 44818 / JCM 13857 / NBRC 105044 / CNB-440) TaxID=369723 RepID=A4X3F3_SALTO|nr:hypothetical protein [Salinispora tropica]ABP53403.1 hypothetical protein Strop_0926 [Salinispora tropica CNB-440]
MLTAAEVLAQNNFGNTRTGGLAGPMGLFLILVLAIATVLLIRNMNARLRRLPAQFPPASGSAPSGAGRADATAGEVAGGTQVPDSSLKPVNGPQQP